MTPASWANRLTYYWSQKLLKELSMSTAEEVLNTPPKSKTKKKTAAEPKPRRKRQSRQTRLNGKFRLFCKLHDVKHTELLQRAFNAGADAQIGGLT